MVENTIFLSITILEASITRFNGNNKGENKTQRPIRAQISS